jgi:hypothetical protein
MTSDAIYTNGDLQQQSLMRSHSLRVKVTLILSRKYFFFLFNLHIHSFLPVAADHTGELLFTYLPQLNIVTVQGKLSGLKAQQR